MSHKTDTVTYYQFEVDHPIKGWLRVGLRYTNKDAAKGWRSLVKAAWRGLPTRLAKDTMLAPAVGGGGGREGR
jgi:hypothetical protein